jgi:hypothetical protein
MKIKYEGTGIEITDKDSKNLISFLEYYISLSNEDKNKIRQIVLGGIGVTTYASIIYFLIRRRE